MKKAVLAGIVAAAFVSLQMPALAAAERPALQTAEEHLERGILFAENGEFDIAILDFTEAIRLDPHLAMAYYWRGLAHRGIVDTHNFTTNRNFDPERRGLAIADFTNAIRLDSGFALAYTRRGLMHFESGDNDRAIDDQNQAIRIDPSFSMAFTFRGWAHWDRGDYEQAFADYTEAIRLDPGNARAFTSRGNGHRLRGDYDLAIADFTQAIRLDPNNTGARSNLNGVQAGRAFQQLIDEFAAAQRRSNHRVEIRDCFTADVPTHSTTFHASSDSVQTLFTQIAVLFRDSGLEVMMGYTSAFLSNDRQWLLSSATGSTGWNHFSIRIRDSPRTGTRGVYDVVIWDHNGRFVQQMFIR